MRCLITNQPIPNVHPSQRYKCLVWNLLGHTFHSYKAKLNSRKRDEFSCGKISRKRRCLFFPGNQTSRRQTCPEKLNPEAFFSVWSFFFFFSGRSKSRRPSWGFEALSARQDLLPTLEFFFFVHIHLQMGSPIWSQQCLFFVCQGSQSSQGLSLYAPGHLWPQKVLSLSLSPFCFRLVVENMCARENSWNFKA